MKMISSNIAAAIEKTGANPSPPELLARAELGDVWALLYSSMQSQGSGRYSYLASHPKQVIEADHFKALAKTSHEKHLFGYLGYGLRHDVETLHGDEASYIDQPNLAMFEPSKISVWDHQTGDLQLNHEGKNKLNNCSEFSIKSLNSNMNTPEYISIIERTLNQIRKGVFYQANITRKFFGEFDSAPNPIQLFTQLCELSPSPFSAMMRFGETYILSSSPESFVQVDARGNVSAKPIKGSARRGMTAEEDAEILETLKASEKDKAENLMIVDLMRNDLARACEAGSVGVSELQEIYSYETIHQMISTITGKRRSDMSTLDLIKACFPPGSMTGAPKITVMNWCSEQEKMARGVYSGALGWIGADGRCDLSVVIRTVIIQGNRFEFQVGGGIVADSNPEAEWEESLLKAKAIAHVLGIPMDELRAL